MIENTLFELGLSPKESRVYIELVKRGALAVSTLSTFTRIKRTSLYDILKTLEEKNLIISFKKGNCTLYKVDDIQKIHEKKLAELKLSEQAVNELRAIQLDEPYTELKHYLDAKDFSVLYHEILNSDYKEFCGWINMEYFLKYTDQKKKDEWTRTCVNGGVFARFIMQDNEYSRAFKKEDHLFLRKTVLIPKITHELFSTCLIYGNQIIYLDTENGTTGISIHNPELARLQQEIFEMCWNQYVD